MGSSLAFMIVNKDELYRCNVWTDMIYSSGLNQCLEGSFLFLICLKLAVSCDAVWEQKRGWRTDSKPEFTLFILKEWLSIS